MSGKSSTKYKLTIVVTESVYKSLTAAATHREKMTPETVAAEIVGGVCTRGSIQKALNQWGDYLGDRRCRSSLGEIGG
jgi:hypothetical protein